MSYLERRGHQNKYLSPTRRGQGEVPPIAHSFIFLTINTFHINIVLYSN